MDSGPNKNDEKKQDSEIKPGKPEPASAYARMLANMRPPLPPKPKVSDEEMAAVGSIDRDQEHAFRNGSELIELAKVQLELIAEAALRKDLDDWPGSKAMLIDYNSKMKELAFNVLKGREKGLLFRPVPARRIAEEVWQKVTSSAEAKIEKKAILAWGRAKGIHDRKLVREKEKQALLILKNRETFESTPSDATIKELWNDAGAILAEKALEKAYKEVDEFIQLNMPINNDPEKKDYLEALREATKKELLWWHKQDVLIGNPAYTAKQVAASLRIAAAKLAIDARIARAEEKDPLGKAGYIEAAKAWKEELAKRYQRKIDRMPLNGSARPPGQEDHSHRDFTFDDLEQGFVNISGKTVNFATLLSESAVDFLNNKGKKPGTTAQNIQRNFVAIKQQIDIFEQKKLHERDQVVDEKSTQTVTDLSAPSVVTSTGRGLASLAAALPRRMGFNKDLAYAFREKAKKQLVEQAKLLAKSNKDDKGPIEIQICAGVKVTLNKADSKAVRELAKAFKELDEEVSAAEAKARALTRKREQDTRRPLTIAARKSNKKNKEVSKPTKAERLAVEKAKELRANLENSKQREVWFFSRRLTGAVNDLADKYMNIAKPICMDAADSMLYAKLILFQDFMSMPAVDSRFFKTSAVSAQAKIDHNSVNTQLGKIDMSVRKEKTKFNARNKRGSLTDDMKKARQANKTRLRNIESTLSVEARKFLHNLPDKLAVVIVDRNKRTDADIEQFYKLQAEYYKEIGLPQKCQLGANQAHWGNLTDLSSKNRRDFLKIDVASAKATMEEFKEVQLLEKKPIEDFSEKYDAINESLSSIENKLEQNQTVSQKDLDGLKEAIKALPKENPFRKELGRLYLTMKYNVGEMSKVLKAQKDNGQDHSVSSKNSSASVVRSVVRWISSRSSKSQPNKTNHPALQQPQIKKGSATGVEQSHQDKSNNSEQDATKPPPSPSM